MTLAEIQSATINPLIAREAYEHAAKRLDDALQTKAAFEQKAFTLFGGYLTISLALLAASGAAYDSQRLRHLFIPFLVTGIIFVVGDIMFMVALKARNYGALASHPDMWLNTGVIDGPDSVLPTMLAYITFYHQERIDTSVARNEAKAKWIESGIWLGIVAPAIFIVLVVIF